MAEKDPSLVSYQGDIHSLGRTISLLIDEDTDIKLVELLEKVIAVVFIYSTFIYESR